MLRKAVPTVSSLYRALYDSMPAVALCFLSCLYRFYDHKLGIKRKSNPFSFDRVFSIIFPESRFVG